ncbi:sensor histidine kinase [Salipiger sp. PrR002]|uniref:sensor histidine kinase n=1 Tax=Salipiger sp. PrR002 TaxID=2706489 RepID=UPI0034CDB95C
MSRRSLSLRVSGLVLMIGAALAGMVITGMWSLSQTRWTSHLDHAERAGILLYHTLTRGAAPPEGVTVTPLAEIDANAAAVGNFSLVSGLPKPRYVTLAPILPDGTGGEGIELAVISDGLQYRVAELPSRPGQRPEETLGQLTRLMARYCSHPQIIARSGESGWLRVEAPGVWGCEAAPRDLRLPAIALALITLGVFFTRVTGTAAQFSDFAQALATRRRLGGPESYETEGPAELRAIVDAVNAYLEDEREQLAKRAVVLSGVSHDLGTPATRLRLRSALIEDDALRGKFEADIDKMTAIIESALTYTRAELSVEDPRQLSLSALVEALVDDYQDMGHPVTLARVEPMVLRGGRSLFSARRGAQVIEGAHRILVTARPVSIQRAISNLVDNALKYGRRAELHLEATADTATIIVEDESGLRSTEQIEALMAPFRRGANARSSDGTGLGLSIVSTIAMLHGGTLRFETAPKGLRAVLTIQRA